MHKGCIMQVEKDYAVVLTEDMEYKKIKRKENIEIGKKIFFFQDDLYKESIIKNYGTWVASVAIFIIVFNIYRIQMMAASVVSIDINPSLQMELNKKHKVIRVKPLNEDAKKIIEEVSLINKDAQEAILLIVDQAKTHHYLTQEKNVVLVSSVELSKRSSKNEDSLEKVVGNQLDIKLKEQQIEMIYIQSTPEDYKQAVKQNISIGKYETYKEKTKLLPENSIKNNQQLENSEKKKGNEINLETYKSLEGEFNEYKPKGGKSNESKPKEGKSSESKPKVSKSNESKPNEGKSNESKPKVSKSNESKPNEGKSNESKPKVSKSNEDKSNEGRFKENKSNEGKLEGNKKNKK